MSAWTLIIPVKPFEHAKTRTGLPLRERVELARLLAQHTIETATASAAVRRVVIVGEQRASCVGRAKPIIHLHEPDPGGLNNAICVARDHADERWPHDPIAVLPADLPYLAAPELDQALARAENLDKASIADKQGTGTTLLTAMRPSMLHPKYGPGSARYHQLGGHVEIIGYWPGLSHDLDTLTDLENMNQGSTMLA